MFELTLALIVFPLTIYFILQCYLRLSKTIFSYLNKPGYYLIATFIMKIVFIIVIIPYIS